MDEIFLEVEDTEAEEVKEEPKMKRWVCTKDCQRRVEEVSTESPILFHYAGEVVEAVEQPGKYWRETRAKVTDNLNPPSNTGQK